MKTLLRLEEAAMFGASIVIFSGMDFAWWWYPALILAPDIGMLGYVVSSRAGALTYNLLHHKGIAILLCCAGFYLSNDWVGLAGLIMFGHASMDRMLGYGLKYGDSFHHTHLGWIGGKNAVIGSE